jgi:hypothetical protein
VVGFEGSKRMNWTWLVIPVFSVFGLAVGWVVGTILLSFRDDPMDIWEDWED